MNDNLYTETLTPSTDDAHEDLAVIDETGDPSYEAEVLELGAPPSPSPIARLIAQMIKGLPKKPVIGAWKGGNRDVQRIKKGGNKKIIATPSGMEKVKAAIAASKVARPSDVFYTRVKNGLIKFDSRGAVINRMRPAEVYAVMNAMFTGTPVSPDLAVFPAPISGLTFLPIANVVNGVAGYVWAGYLMTFEVAQLNLVTDAQITVKTYHASFDPSGVAPAFTQRFMMSRTSTTTTICSLLSVMINARPRFCSSAVSPGEVGAPGAPNRIEIIGLPAQYSAKLRVLVPGDSDTEAFINVL